MEKPVKKLLVSKEKRFRQPQKLGRLINWWMQQNTKVMAKAEKNHQEVKLKNTKVEINFPSRISIELVQGNELRHYEIFFLITTLTLSTAVSFWTTYAITPNGTILFSAWAFSGFAFLSGIVTFYYRSKLYNGKITKSASLDAFKAE